MISKDGRLKNIKGKSRDQKILDRINSGKSVDSLKVTLATIIFGLMIALFIVKVL